MRRAALALTLLPLISTTVARAQAQATPGETVVVRGVRTAHDAAAVAVPADEAAAVAGTEGDPVKVIYDLPGVGRPSFDSGALIVWGSSPQDTRTYIDGVEIPALFHGAALRSTVNADLVRDVALAPGAYGTEYGRGLGGIVKVETRDLRDSGVHGYVGADPLDGSAMVSAALGDRLRVAVAGRYGWLDGVLRAVDAPNVDRFFSVPRYGDFQAKAQLDLREGETLDAVFLASSDALTETAPDADPGLFESETTRTTYQRFYLRYRRHLPDGSSVDVVPWVGHDGSSLDQTFGATPATLDASTWRGGVRATHRSRPATWLGMALGVDLDFASARLDREGSLEVPAREGDIVYFGEPPGPDVDSDAWSAGVVDVAPYAQLDVDAGPVVISPGLRADGFLLTASRQTPVLEDTPSVGLSHLQGKGEPRIAARWRVTPRLSTFAAAGVYSQPPAPADLSAVFGNPTLGVESADHAALGESLRITGTLSAEVVGFFKSMSGLAVRNPSPTPALAQALLPEGIGRSYGVQLLLRQSGWRGFSGWLSYTISRSERRDWPGSAWRLFDYDQPHVMTIACNQKLGAWTLGARFRVASGLPRTPVIGAFFTASESGWEPIFGEQNSIRLPAFAQLDLRVDRRFDLGHDAALRLYLEGLDVTNRANAEEFVYSTSFAQRGTVTGLPFLALAGARIDL